MPIYSNHTETFEYGRALFVGQPLGFCEFGRVPSVTRLDGYWLEATVRVKEGDAWVAATPRVRVGGSWVGVVQAYVKVTL